MTFSEEKWAICMFLQSSGRLENVNLGSNIEKQQIQELHI